MSTVKEFETFVLSDATKRDEVPLRFIKEFGQLSKFTSVEKEVVLVINKLSQGSVDTVLVNKGLLPESAVSQLVTLDLSNDKVAHISVFVGNSNPIKFETSIFEELDQRVTFKVHVKLNDTGIGKISFECVNCGTQYDFVLEVPVLTHVIKNSLISQELSNYLELDEIENTTKCCTMHKTVALARFAHKLISQKGYEVDRKTKMIVERMYATHLAIAGRMCISELLIESLEEDINKVCKRLRKIIKAGSL